jgi:hypothetical protein
VSDASTQAIVPRAPLDPARGAVQLTWVLFLLDPPGHPISDVPLTILAILGLTIPRLCWHPLLWWIATPLTVVPVIQDWFGVDNHEFLRVYWTLSIAVAASRPLSTPEFASGARRLIGLVFLFATLWKALISPDFTDGRYLRFAFMTDSRFAGWSALIGGLGAEQQDINRELVRDWLSSPDSRWDSDFTEPPRLRAAAFLVTGMVLILELSIAVCFLLPLGRGPSRFRDPLLLLFGITAYAVATVDGFGWLLCAMGLAQADPERPRVAIAYLSLFALILIYARSSWLGWLIAVYG